MNRSPVQSLPASWYSDIEIFERERQQIFKPAWWLLGPAEELSAADAFVCDRVAGHSIFALRDERGVLRAFHNVCRHRAAPLLKHGSGQCRRIICPYHRWVYGRDGQLLSAAGFGGDVDLADAGLNLFPVRIDTWNNLAFVCMDAKAPDLIDWLGNVVPLCEAFAPVDALVYYDTFDVIGNANWKTYCDNTVEGYHLESIHPRLGKSLARGQVDIKSYDDGHTIAFHVRYASRSEGAALRSDTGLWIYKYPGFQLVAGANGFKAERVEPTSVNQFRSRNWAWYRDMEDNEKRDAFDWSQQVVNEDTAICEQVQTNLATGIFTQGPLSATQESHVARLQQIIRHDVEQGQ